MKAIASVVAVTLAAGGALAAGAPARLLVAPLCAPTESWNQDGKMATYLGTGWVCGCDPLAWGQIAVYHALNHGAPAATFVPPDLDWFNNTNGCTVVEIDKDGKRTTLARHSLRRDPYDWVAVRDRKWVTLPDGKEENPVARLMYDFGAIGNATYSPGATMGTVDQNGFKWYFGFADGYHYTVPREYGEETTYWRDMLKRILRVCLQVRAPLGAGINLDVGGHMVVVDGWGVDAAGNDLFHVNKGWGGSENGWLTLEEAYNSPTKSDGLTHLYANVFPADLGSVVVGRVVSHERAPIAGATVTLTHENGTVWTGTTDAEGCYVFTGLPRVDAETLYDPAALPTHAYTVTVAAQGYATQTQSLTIESYIDDALQSAKQNAWEAEHGKGDGDKGGGAEPVVYPLAYGGAVADFTLEPAGGRTVFLAAGGTGKGASWADAAPFDQATLNAAAGRVVHVAAGDTVISAPLVVPRGTTLMGGYNPATGARDPLATPTSITLKGAAYPTSAVTLNPDCVFDGFQVWDADKAVVNGVLYANGGTGAMPIVRNCVLSEGRNGWAAQYCDIATSILLGDTVNLEGCAISHCTFAGQIGEAKNLKDDRSSLLGVGLGGLRPAVAPAACPHLNHAVCPNGLDGRPLDSLGALAPDAFGVEVVKSARGYRLRLR